VEIERDGVTLRGTRWGDAAAGRPLVFVHGWSCNRSFFAPQVERFAARQQCVAFDHRGHGSSDVPDADAMTIEALAADVAAQIEDLELEGAVVIGHSMGAVTGFELAHRRPELVAGLVMVDSAPLRKSDTVAELMRGTADAMDVTAESDSLRRSMVAEFMFTDSASTELRTWILDEMALTPAITARTFWRALADYTAARPLRGVPVMHIAAGNELTGDDTLRLLLPDGRLEATPDVGHFNQFEAPGRVGDLIDDFVGGIG